MRSAFWSSVSSKLGSKVLQSCSLIFATVLVVGKESVNATIPVGIVMCRAIRDFYDLTGIKVGLKPAGGIRTSADAISWLILVKEYLGNEWLNPQLFRIGASGLLSDIERELYSFVFGKYPSLEYPLPLA